MIKRFAEELGQAFTSKLADGVNDFCQTLTAKLTRRTGSTSSSRSESIYDGYVNLEKFQEIAEKASKPVKRIADYYTSKGKAVFTVNSISSISQWQFWVDFNDQGRITGSCKWNSENSDSDIPDRVANEMHRLVNEAIAEEKARLELEFERERRIREEQARHEGYVNSSEDTIIFYCKMCGQRLSVPRTEETLKTRCPNCGYVKYI